MGSSGPVDRSQETEPLHRFGGPACMAAGERVNRTSDTGPGNQECCIGETSRTTAVASIPTRLAHQPASPLCMPSWPAPGQSSEYSHGAALGAFPATDSSSGWVIDLISRVLLIPDLSRIARPVPWCCLGTLSHRLPLCDVSHQGCGCVSIAWRPSALSLSLIRERFCCHGCIRSFH